MSKEEIRKLLGGYATNTLTESERNALFEAALDDQELFNALQEEESLKTLLANPAVRADVRQALDQQPSGGSHATGRMRWWAWGGAASAVAAAAVLFAVFHQNSTVTTQTPIQIASNEKAPSSLPPAEAKDQKAVAEPAAKQARKKTFLAAKPEAPAKNSSPAAPTPAPPPLIPPPVQQEATQAFRQQAQGSLIAGQSGQGQDKLALAQLSAVPLLRYSLLKQEVNAKESVLAPERDLKPGDLVRFQVLAGTAGHLTLSRLDETGQWQPVADTTVRANTASTIPDSPIQVPATPQKYRLTLLRSATQVQTIGGVAGAGTRNAIRAARDTESTVSAPVVVEITLGGTAGN